MGHEAKIVLIFFFFKRRLTQYHAHYLFVKIKKQKIVIVLQQSDKINFTVYYNNNIGIR